VVRVSCSQDERIRHLLRTSTAVGLSGLPDGRDERPQYSQGVCCESRTTAVSTNSIVDALTCTPRPAQHVCDASRRALRAPRRLRRSSLRILPRSGAFQTSKGECKKKCSDISGCPRTNQAHTCCLVNRTWRAGAPICDACRNVYYGLMKLTDAAAADPSAEDPCAPDLSPHQALKESPAAITPNTVLFRGQEAGITPLRMLGDGEAAISPSLSPYLSNRLLQTPAPKKNGGDPEFLPSPSLSPYLTRAGGSPASCCSSSVTSGDDDIPDGFSDYVAPSHSSLPSTPQPLPAEHGVSASLSMVSPLLSLPSSEKNWHYSRDKRRRSIQTVEDEAREEQAKEALACKRLVELVDIHSTIVRVVADSEEGAPKPETLNPDLNLNPKP